MFGPINQTDGDKMAKNEKSLHELGTVSTRDGDMSP